MIYILLSIICLIVGPVIGTSSYTIAAKATTALGQSEIKDERKRTTWGSGAYPFFCNLLSSC